MDDSALAEQLVTLYRVDMLIDVSGTDVTKAFVEAHKYLRNPFHHPLFHPRFHEADKSAAIVDIQHPIGRIYGEYYKNNLNADRSTGSPTARSFRHGIRGAIPSQDTIGSSSNAIMLSAIIGIILVSLSGMLTIGLNWSRTGI